MVCNTFGKVKQIWYRSSINLAVLRPQIIKERMQQPLERLQPFLRIIDEHLLKEVHEIGTYLVILKVLEILWQG